MKFKEPQGFFSHLKDASFDHLCPVYLIVISDDYERSQIIHYSKKFFLKDNITCTKFDGQDLSYQKISQEAVSPSLFSQTSFFIIDNIHKLAGLSKFVQLVESFKDGFFLLASPTIKGIELLEKKVEKNGVVLDLSKEKPWEHNARIEKMLFSKAKMKKTQLSMAAHKRLIEKVGYNLALLDQELQKLILFTYETKKIEVEDVEKVVKQTAEISSWQRAEKLVFEKKYPKDLSFNASDAHLFLSAIRYQLQLGFKMALLMKRNISSNELKAHFPKLWPKLFEMRKKQVQTLSQSYFQNGLTCLFDAEFALRDLNVSFKAIIDLFISRLYHAQS